MSNFYKVIALSLLCALPVTMTTSCTRGGGGGEPPISRTITSDQIREFINWVEIAVIFAGDKLSVEERDQIDDALANLRELADSGEEVSFVQVLNEVILPVVAGKTAEDLSDEDLENILLAATGIQYLIDQYEGEAGGFEEAYQALEDIKDLVREEIRKRRAEEGLEEE